MKKAMSMTRTWLSKNDNKWLITNNLRMTSWSQKSASSTSKLLLMPVLSAERLMVVRMVEHWEPMLLSPSLQLLPRRQMLATSRTTSEETGRQNRTVRKCLAIFPNEETLSKSMTWMQSYCSQTWSSSTTILRRTSN